MAFLFVHAFEFIPFTSLNRRVLARVDSLGHPPGGLKTSWWVTPLNSGQRQTMEGEEGEVLGILLY
jgi:hypothetical protein